ncbi:tetratricopeptide repeat protein [bacterium]|nr:tetratricopeptide repeat protein [bacterium]
MSKSHRRVVVNLLSGLVCVLLLNGCASGTHYALGRQAMEEDDYSAALEHFTICLKTGENNADATRELGILFYKQGKIRYAAAVLEKAVGLDNTDGRAMLFLGAAYEALKEYDKAINLLRRHNSFDLSGSEHDDISAKLDELMRLKMRADAHTAIAQESMLDLATIPDSTVAVLHFANLGDKRGLDPLQKGIAEMLISDLSKVPGIRIIERARLPILMDEMKLNQAGLIKDNMAPRVGRLLGAAQIINGNFIDLSGRNIKINAGLSRSKVAGSVESIDVEGPFTRLFQLEKNLVFKLVDRMGIRLSQKQRDEISIIPTENILAFVAYSSGLDFEDRGLFDRAQQQYQRALQLDPAFSKVAKAMNRTSIKAQGSVKLTSLAAPAGSKKPKKESSQNTSVSTKKKVQPGKKQQMRHVGSVLNQRFLPGIDARKPQQEQQASTMGAASSIELVIPLTSLQ